MGTLEETYRLVLRGEVDQGAPARASATIDIAAEVAVVWDALANVTNWPRIREDITDAAAIGPATPGGEFTWRAGGVPIASTFAVVERPSRLTWINSAPGLAMACVYLFEGLGPQRTRLRGEESIDAPVAAPHIDDRVLADNIRSWLAGIKSFVES